MFDNGRLRVGPSRYLVVIYGRSRAVYVPIWVPVLCWFTSRSIFIHGSVRHKFCSVGRAAWQLWLNSVLVLMVAHLHTFYLYLPKKTLIVSIWWWVLSKHPLNGWTLTLKLLNVVSKSGWHGYSASSCSECNPVGCEKLAKMWQHPTIKSHHWTSRAGCWAPQERKVILATNRMVFDYTAWLQTGHMCPPTTTGSLIH